MSFTFLTIQRWNIERSVALSPTEVPGSILPSSIPSDWSDIPLLFLPQRLISEQSTTNLSEYFLSLPINPASVTDESFAGIIV